MAQTDTDREFPNIADLPWFSDNRWNPRPTDNYGYDCAVGRMIGRDVLRLLDRTACPAHLALAAKMISDSGQWGGVELGFWSAIAERIYA